MCGGTNSFRFSLRIIWVKLKAFLLVILFTSFPPCHPFDKGAIFALRARYVRAQYREFCFFAVTSVTRGKKIGR